VCLGRSPDHAAWAYQFPDGAIATGCSHNSCSGKGLDEMRDVLEPGWNQSKTKERQSAESDDGDGSDDNAAPSEGDEKKSKQRGPSQADQLVALASAAQLFHDADGGVWATILAGTHFETWPLHSKGFKRWLARRLYELTGKAPGAQPMQDALGVLDGRAAYDGPQLTVYTRLAQCDDAIWLDLADDEWRVVKITATRWEVLRESPVRFRRAKPVFITSACFARKPAAQAALGPVAPWPDSMPAMYFLAHFLSERTK
jgi:hypothetical protein